MVDDYEYEAGTLNEQWDQFEIKEDKAGGRLVIQRQDAARTELFTLGDGGNVSVDTLNSIKYVSSADDLPVASGGERQLADNTAYYFTQFVTDTASLRLGENSPLIGAHGGVNGYIYTGGGDALVGTNKGFFARNMYFHAPGGTMFNLVGDTSTEMLVEMCSFSDAAGLGQDITDLGTIDGYRVPSIKGSNFEDFDQGITFTGTSDKVFIEGSPFRTIDSAGVTIFDFDANFTTDIVDIVDCYIKGVQSDTVVVDVDNSATINDIFQYRGVTHDSSVTEDNILTGAAGFDQVGYVVRSSYPVEDSAVAGELSLDGPTTINTAAAGADTYTIIDDGATSLGPESERVSQQSNGVIQIDSKTDATLYITANVTVDTGGDTVALAMSKNGNVQTTSEMTITGSASTNSFLSAGEIEHVTNGDTIEAQIKNVEAAADITVQSFTLNVVGV